MLDIGCGEGTQMVAAQADGWQVVGTELHPDALRRLGLSVFRDLTELPDQPAFDCITLWHSLEHMRDPLSTIRAARARLSRHGVLLLAVPDNGGLQAKLFGKHWLHLDVPRHLYHFGRPSLTALLKAAGFSPLRWWNQEFEYDLMGFSDSSLSAVSPTAGVWFAMCSGRQAGVSTMSQLLHCVGGAALSVVGVPVVLLSTAARKGGTLVVAAKAQF